MTTTTQSNAVLRNSICLTIINMMNIFSVFFTDCANISISFSDRTLKSFTKGWRIWLKRFSAFPSWSVFPRHIFETTLLRTIRSIKSTWRLVKRFLTISTKHFFSNLFSARVNKSVNSKIICFFVDVGNLSFWETINDIFPFSKRIELLKKFFLIRFPEFEDMISSVQSKFLGATFYSTPCSTNLLDNSFLFNCLVIFQKIFIFFFFPVRKFTHDRYLKRCVLFGKSVLLFMQYRPNEDAYEIKKLTNCTA